MFGIFSSSRRERIFFIHIMKTAGTSFRRMLISEFGPRAVFPNDAELSAMPHGWYPTSDVIAKTVDSLRKHKILVGHHPFSLLEKLGKNYKPITFIREPFSRTLSMLGHRKRTVPGCEQLSYEELLDNEKFVQVQVLNYQTKVLSMGIEPVNSIQPTTEADLQTAIANLQRLAFVGLNEHFTESCRLFDKKFKTKLAENIKHENVNAEAVEVSETVRKKIAPLIEFDVMLYREALKIFERDLSTHGIQLTKT